MTDDGVEPETLSLCLQPNGFREFHFCALDETRTVRDEIVATIAPIARTAMDEAHLIGEVLGRMRTAARGETPSTRDEFEPVRRYPGVLFELKWRFRRRGEYRMYHSEPGSNPDLVALHFHQKVIESLTDQEIEDAQETAMDLAEDRRKDKKTRRWGHVSACRHCLPE